MTAVCLTFAGFDSQQQPFSYSSRGNWSNGFTYGARCLLQPNDAFAQANWRFESIESAQP